MQTFFVVKKIKIIENMETVPVCSKHSTNKKLLAIGFYPFVPVTH